MLSNFLYPSNKGAIPRVMPLQSITNKTSDFNTFASSALLSWPSVDIPSYKPFVPSIIAKSDPISLDR